MGGGGGVEPVMGYFSWDAEEEMGYQLGYSRYEVMRKVEAPLEETL